MFARRHQVALALTAVLAVAAACQADHRAQRHGPAGLPAPAEPGAGRAAGAVVLVASGGVLPDGRVVAAVR